MSRLKEVGHVAENLLCLDKSDVFFLFTLGIIQMVSLKRLQKGVYCTELQRQASSRFNR